jgi:hypothetical protein
VSETETRFSEIHHECSYKVSCFVFHNLFFDMMRLTFLVALASQSESFKVNYSVRCSDHVSDPLEPGTVFVSDTDLDSLVRIKEASEYVGSVVTEMIDKKVRGNCEYRVGGHIGFWEIDSMDVNKSHYISDSYLCALVHLARLEQCAHVAGVKKYTKDHVVVSYQGAFTLWRNVGFSLHANGILTINVGRDEESDCSIIRLVSAERVRNIAAVVWSLPLGLERPVMCIKTKTGNYSMADDVSVGFKKGEFECKYKSRGWGLFSCESDDADDCKSQAKRFCSQAFQYIVSEPVLVGFVDL